MNPTAVDRLSALLRAHRGVPRYRRCMCGFAPTRGEGFCVWHEEHLTQTIVAAGWGHPDELTDEQVDVVLDAGVRTWYCDEVEFRASDFRAALARANKGG